MDDIELLGETDLPDGALTIELNNTSFFETQSIEEVAKVKPLELISQKILSQLKKNNKMPDWEILQSKNCTIEVTIYGNYKISSKTLSGLDALQYIMQKTLSYDGRSSEKSPFTIINTADQIQCIQDVMAYGLDINKPYLKLNEKYADWEEETPLSQAARHHNIVLMEFLLNKGAKVTPSVLRSTNGGFSEHHNKLCEHTILFFMGRGIDINMSDEKGGILHTKFFSNCYDDSFMEFLLEKGLDHRLVNQSGQSLLHIAVKKMNHDQSIMLIEHGADLYLTDNEGNTPFSLADGRYFQERLLIYYERYQEEKSHKLSTVHTNKIDKTAHIPQDVNEKQDLQKTVPIYDVSNKTPLAVKPKITVGYVFNELFGTQSAQAAHPIAIGTGKALMYGSGMLLGAIAGNKAVEDYKNYQLFSNYSGGYAPYSPEGSYQPALTGNPMISGLNTGLFDNPIDQMRFDGVLPAVDTQTTRNNIVANKGRTMPIMDSETSALLRDIDANLDRPNITDFSTHYQPRSILFTPDSRDSLSELSRLPGFSPAMFNTLQESFPDDSHRLKEFSNLPGFTPVYTGIPTVETFPDQSQMIDDFDMSILERKIELDYDKLSKEHFDNDVSYIHRKKYEGAKITDIDSDVAERMSGLIITDKSEKIRGVHNTQDHHIIHQVTDGAKELFDDLGLDIHGPENRITLPSDIKLTEHEITNMTQHVGRHDDDVLIEIEGEVEEIRTALAEGELSKERSKEKLLKIIQKQRNGLETGKNPLNSVGRE